MYKLSDGQINFILEDIRSRGIVNESLQNDLLDHICCIIELRMQENDDFHSFYTSTIRTFYKTELSEIEHETLALLTFKNYYTMKKIMILSGTFSAFTMIVGIWFKHMHYPGAATLLPLGIICGSFIFMPLLFTLKAREKQTTRDKLVLLPGAVSILLIALGFIVKLIGGPSASTVPMYLFYLSAAVSLCAFLPFYLTSGLRNPQTKINTLVTAVLVVMGYALLFSMTYNQRYIPKYRTMQTFDYLRSQQILNSERQLADQKKNTITFNHSTISHKIDRACEQIKAELLEKETGYKSIEIDFEKKNIYLLDHSIYLDLQVQTRITELRNLVKQYHTAISGPATKIPLNATFLDQGENKIEHIGFFSLLNQLTQLQMLVLQNERQLLADK